MGQSSYKHSEIAPFIALSFLVVSKSTTLPLFAFIQYKSDITVARLDFRLRPCVDLIFDFGVSLLAFIVAVLRTVLGGVFTAQCREMGDPMQVFATKMEIKLPSGLRIFSVFHYNKADEWPFFMVLTFKTCSNFFWIIPIQPYKLGIERCVFMVFGLQNVCRQANFVIQWPHFPTPKAHVRFVLWLNDSSVHHFR